MADHQQRPVELSQGVLQYFERLDVEVIGRLVEDEQPRRFPRPASPPVPRAAARHPTACASRLRKAKRAHCAWALSASSSGWRARRLSRMLCCGSSSAICWSSIAIRPCARCTSPATGSSCPAAIRSSVVLPAPFAPLSATRSGPSIRSDHGPSRRLPSATSTRSSASTLAADGISLSGMSIRSGVTISTLARASSVRFAASAICRSPVDCSRPPVFSARSARAPSRIFGCDPLAATARPALSRRALASRRSCADRRADRSAASARAPS